MHGTDQWCSGIKRQLDRHLAQQGLETPFGGKGLHKIIPLHRRANFRAYAAANEHPSGRKGLQYQITGFRAVYFHE